MLPIRMADAMTHVALTNADMIGTLLIRSCRPTR
jgi:hypothetical protein